MTVLDFTAAYGGQDRLPRQRPALAGCAETAPDRLTDSG
jgi:hypothetical protein